MMLVWRAGGTWRPAHPLSTSALALWGGLLLMKQPPMAWPPPSMRSSCSLPDTCAPGCMQWATRTRWAPSRSPSRARCVCAAERPTGQLGMPTLGGGTHWHACAGGIAWTARTQRPHSATIQRGPDPPAERHRGEIRDGMQHASHGARGTICSNQPRRRGGGGCLQGSTSHTGARPQPPTAKPHGDRVVRSPPGAAGPKLRRTSRHAARGAPWPVLLRNQHHTADRHAFTR